MGLVLDVVVAFLATFMAGFLSDARTHIHYTLLDVAMTRIVRSL